MHRYQFAEFDDEELKSLLGLLNRVFWTGAQPPVEGQTSEGRAS